MQTARVNVEAVITTIRDFVNDKHIRELQNKLVYPDIIYNQDLNIIETYKTLKTMKFIKNKM